MTHAVCVYCGAMKFGALVPCKACGQAPRGKRAATYSFVLSDWHFPVDQLREFSRGMVEEGRSHPVLNPDQEARMIEAYGKGWSGD